jgi:hypothetical protein
MYEMACRLERRGHSPRFAMKGLPFCQERFAASASKTGTTGDMFEKTFRTFLGNGMVPKSVTRPTFLTRGSCKAEQVTLNF